LLVTIVVMPEMTRLSRPG